MRYLIIIFFLSCSSVFIQDDRINLLWQGRHQSEIVDKLGSYTRVINVEDGHGSQILIWEASKGSALISVEKLGIRADKKETSISSFHVFIDKEGNITEIKKSVW